MQEENKFFASHTSLLAVISCDFPLQHGLALNGRLNMCASTLYITCAGRVMDLASFLLVYA